MKNTHKILSFACLFTVLNPSLLFSKEVILSSGDGYVTLEQTSPTTFRRAKITRSGEEYQTLLSGAPTIKMIGGNPSIYTQTANEYRKQCSSQSKNKPPKVAHLIAIEDGTRYNWYAIKETGSVLHASVSPNREDSWAEKWNREGKHQTFPAGDNEHLLRAAEETILKECFHFRPWKRQQINAKRGKIISAIEKNLWKQNQPRKWVKRREELKRQ